MKTIKLSKVCSCGKGYRSRIDGKCENCRNQKDKDELYIFWRNITILNVSPDSLKGKVLRFNTFGAIYEIN